MLNMETIGDKYSLLEFTSNLFNLPELKLNYEKKDADPIDKIILPARIADEISQIKALLVLSLNKLTVEITTRILNLQADLESFIHFKICYPVLINHLHNKNIYIEILKKTPNTKRAMTASIIMDKFNFNQQELITYFNSNVNPIEISQVMHKFKSYEDLPVLSKNVVKEGFIFYAEEYFKMIMITGNTVSSEEEFMSIIVFEERYLIDLVYKKYGFKIDYVKKLLEYHNLLNDEDVSRFISNLKLYQPYNF